MFGISHAPELIALLVIALVIFGPKRIPEIGSSLGKGIKEFRKNTSDDTTPASTTPPTPQQISNAHTVTESPEVRVPAAVPVTKDHEAG